MQPYRKPGHPGHLYCRRLVNELNDGVAFEFAWNDNSKVFKSFDEFAWNGDLEGL
jgi:hypothetical protein